MGESTLVRFFVAFFIEFLDSFNEANKSKNSPPRPLGSAYFKPVVPPSSSDEGYFDFIHFLSHTSGLGLIFLLKSLGVQRFEPEVAGCKESMKATVWAMCPIATAI